jgi:hypothetical protein
MRTISWLPSLELNNKPSLFVVSVASLDLPAFYLVGYKVSALHTAFVLSPSHRTNRLWNKHGVFEPRLETGCVCRFAVRGSHLSG